MRTRCSLPFSPPTAPDKTPRTFKPRGLYLRGSRGGLQRGGALKFRGPLVCGERVPQGPGLGLGRQLQDGDPPESPVSRAARGQQTPPRPRRLPHALPGLQPLEFHFNCAEGTSSPAPRPPPPRAPPTAPGRGDEPAAPPSRHPRQPSARTPPSAGHGLALAPSASASDAARHPVRADSSGATLSGPPPASPGMLRSGDGCAPRAGQSGGSRRRPAGRALGGSGCPETGGAPAVARSARTRDEGGGGRAGARLFCLETGRGGGEGSGSGARCRLAGRALFCSAGSLRAEFLPASLFTLPRSPSPSPVLNHRRRQRSPNPLAGPRPSRRGARRLPASARGRRTLSACRGAVLPLFCSPQKDF
nr:uncharacterized protein LOC110563510 [Meriones unguiculatus]